MLIGRESQPLTLQVLLSEEWESYKRIRMVYFLTSTAAAEQHTVLVTGIPLRAGRTITTKFGEDIRTLAGKVEDAAIRVSSAASRASSAPRSSSNERGATSSAAAVGSDEASTAAPASGTGTW